MTAIGPRPIEDLREGDRVLSQSDDGQLELNPVTEVFRGEGFEHLTINGQLRVTPTHPFWVSGKWVNAGDLRVGERFASIDGSEVEVTSIETANRGSRIYNISVAKAHTFFVDGFLVHNKSPLPQG